MFSIRSIKVGRERVGDVVRFFFYGFWGVLGKLWGFMLIRSYEF